MGKARPLWFRNAEPRSRVATPDMRAVADVPIPDPTRGLDREADAPAAIFLIGVFFGGTVMAKGPGSV
jgi:hypothetical protein